jgi:hypothetical protein
MGAAFLRELRINRELETETTPILVDFLGFVRCLASLPDHKSG